MWIKSLILAWSLLFCPFLFSQDLYAHARTGNMKEIKRILNTSPDSTNALNQSGYSPLMIAVYNGQLKAAKFLIKNGADVNGGSVRGGILAGAVFKGNHKIINLLVKKGAEVSSQGEDGNTALHFAVLAGDLKTAQLLIKNNARLDLKNGSGQTPLSLAEAAENIEMILLLKKNND